MDNARVKIIFMNGPSSVGKSSIAKEIQKQANIPFFHLSSDQFIESKMLPEKYKEKFSWDDLRPKFFNGFHNCLPAIASAGNNIIVDHIVEYSEWLADLVFLLKDFDVFYVGLTCDLCELERREIQRGDRYIGESKEHLEVVHSFSQYDLFIDTTNSSPQESAAKILEGLKNPNRNNTFEELRQEFKNK